MSFYEQLIAATAAERAQLLAAPVIADCLQGRVSHGELPRLSRPGLPPRAPHDTAC
jgi:hypothetical protein